MNGCSITEFDSERDFSSAPAADTNNNNNNDTTNDNYDDVTVAAMEEAAMVMHTQEDLHLKYLSNDRAKPNIKGVPIVRVETGGSGPAIPWYMGKSTRKFSIRFAVVSSYFIIGCFFFTNVEEWNTVEALYFIASSLTTVGYGDYYPTSTGSKVFTVFYILFGICYIFNLIAGYVGDIITHYQNKVIRKPMKKIKDNEEGAQGDGEEGEGGDDTDDLKEPHFARVIFSVSMIFLCVCTGALVYTINEGWNYGISVWYCFVSTLTLGYGDVLVTKDSSRMFAFFYLLTSVVVVTVAVGQIGKVFLDIKMEKKKLAHLEKGLSIDYFKNMLRHDTDVDGDHRISKIEYLIEMLELMNGINKEQDIYPWLKKFDQLDKSGDGFLDMNDLERLLEDENHEQEELKKELLDKQKIDVGEIIVGLGKMYFINPCKILCRLHTWLTSSSSSSLLSSPSSSNKPNKSPISTSKSPIRTPIISIKSTKIAPTSPTTANDTESKIVDFEH